ncbi:MAG: glycosyl hydrolase family 18 protein [Velocimicrobium sp.]
MQIYVVEEGVTVDDISKKFSVSVDDIIYSNQLTYPYALAIGQALLIPIQEEHEKGQIIRSNGYAYPFINQEILQETLLYLTELSIFSYGFTVEGDLIPPSLPDEWMIEAAINSGTMPILTLTPLGPDGRFSNELITALVNNVQVKQNLVNQLIATMKSKGYQGVDVDFEYIKQEDRDAFTTFVRELTVQMNEIGYQVSVALAPKTSKDQVGLLYQGKDYGGLGAAANYVLLMTYEWGYTLAHARCG